MLIKNSFIGFYILLFFNLSSISGQNSGTFSKYPDLQKNIERYEIDNYQYYVTHLSGNSWNHAYVGKYAPPEHEKNVFRMIYFWDLSSIPQNAVITSAKLYWAGTPSTDYSNPSVINIQIKKYNHGLWNASDAEKWTEITNSTVLRTESIPVNSTFNTALTLDQNFINYLTNSLQQNSAVEIAMRTPIADEESWGTNLNTHVVDFKIEPNIPAIDAVKLEIHYDVPVSTVTFEVKNIFETGIIGVSLNNDPINPNETSPYTFTDVLVGDKANIEAIEQTENGYEWIWNDIEAPNFKSKWKKGNGSTWNVFVADKATSFIVSEDDNGKIYRAGLRKNFSITREEDCSEFDDLYTYSDVTRVVEQNVGTLSAPALQTINGREYKFIIWNDGNLENIREISPTDNEIYTALYKYPTHSNNVYAYSNSGSRKIARDSGGKLWAVYESMGKVWLETSADNGTTWNVQVLNNGRPAKCPAITKFQTSGGENVLLTYQIYFSDFVNALKTECFETTYGNYVSSITTDTSDVFFGLGDYNITELTPAIAAAPMQTSGSLFMIVFNSEDKLNYISGIFSQQNNSMSWITENNFTYELPGSAEEDFYPSLAILNSNSQPFNFHLAYQHKSPLPNSFSSEVRYQLLEVTYDGNSFNLSGGNVEYPSSGSGFDKNMMPTIIALDDNLPRIAWVGGYDDLLGKESGSIGSGKTPQAVIRAKASDGTWYEKFFKYGNDVSYQNINRSDDGKYILAFTEEDNDNFYVKSNEYNTVYAMASSAEELQVANGTDLSSMLALVYYHDNLPYSFEKDDFEINAKPNSIVCSSAREGTILKNQGEFYFVAGDVFLNGEPIEFVAIAEEEDIDDLAELNYYLQTKPFDLNENSDLVFSVLFGITDSLKAYNALGEDESVRFTMQMIDDASGSVIGTYDDVTYNRNNLNWYDNIAYQVETSGIGNKTVRLRLKVETNAENASYILGELFAKENVLGKTNRTVVPYQGADAVTDYKLVQNYPNPFNPTTTIKYEIPETGFVTLKIYDVLGREVATLVNAKREAGRYEAEFNAKGLSSGIYIYRIQAGTFVESKKMILLK